MAEPFLGQITMFAGNYAPRNWAYCDGQILDTSQQDTLFSLIGTNYGGNGTTTFALPDMRGRVPIHQGTGPGLSQRLIGEKGGSERVTLSVNQIPFHNHPLQASTQNANSNAPTGNVLAKPENENNKIFDNNSNTYTTMDSDAVSFSGGSKAHSNIAPYLGVHFIIALVGIYPSRN